MKRIFLALSFTLVICVSCNNSSEKKEQASINNQNTEKTIKQLEIHFSFKTSETDVFKIAMNNIKVDELQKKHIQIFETVSPSIDFDNIIAKFDKNNMSKNIVFGLGNKKNKEVTIESINIFFNHKNLNINTPEKMSKFLKFNKFIQRDSTSMILKTNIIDGKHSPSFTLTKKLINSLNKD